MNFLAHLYLSGADHDIMIGNFIADSVKGKQKNSFSASVQEGIVLHRAIDTYTDSHKLVKESVDLFRKRQGRYATVIIDLVFDHFLAKNWSNYYHTDLEHFTKRVYALLEDNFLMLPLRFQKMLPYMRKENWLYQYQFMEGMQKAFSGMAQRASFDTKMDTASLELIENYETLAANFKYFFDDMICFVEKKGILLER